MEGVFFLGYISDKIQDLMMSGYSYEYIKKMTLRDLMPHWVSLKNKQYLQSYINNPPKDKNDRLIPAIFPYYINPDWDNKATKLFTHLIL